LEKDLAGITSKTTAIQKKYQELNTYKVWKKTLQENKSLIASRKA
jgi:hypothetical protein